MIKNNSWLVNISRDDVMHCKTSAKMLWSLRCNGWETCSSWDSSERDVFITIILQEHRCMGGIMLILDSYESMVLAVSADDVSLLELIGTVISGFAISAVIHISTDVYSICTSLLWNDIFLRTRPVWDKKKSSLDLGLAGLVLCWETRSCHTRRHSDLEGHSNFSSTIYSFSILCLEHRCCGDNSGVTLLKS